MIKIINIDNAEKSEILTRDIKLESGVEETVAAIIKNVKENGDAALREYSLKFDGVCPENLRVTKEEIDWPKQKKTPPVKKKLTPLITARTKNL